MLNSRVPTAFKTIFHKTDFNEQFKGTSATTVS